MINENTDMSQLSDVTYICTCVCCDENKFEEGKGITTSDGFSVCGEKCKNIWENGNT